MGELAVLKSTLKASYACILPTVGNTTGQKKTYTSVHHHLLKSGFILCLCVSVCVPVSVTLLPGLRCLVSFNGTMGIWTCKRLHTTQGSNEKCPTGSRLFSLFLGLLSKLIPIHTASSVAVFSLHLRPLTAIYERNGAIVPSHAARGHSPPVPSEGQANRLNAGDGTEPCPRDFLARETNTVSSFTRCFKMSKTLL